MGVSKRIIVKQHENSERAVFIYRQFLNFTEGWIKKVGLLEALTNDEYKWLKKLHERILDFSEQVELKKIPQKIGGDDEGEPIRVIFRAAPNSIKSETR